MTTDEQLKTMMTDRAMSLDEIFAMRDQLRRCVRNCKHYDTEESRCMTGECAGIFIERPALHGCILFED